MARWSDVARETPDLAAAVVARFLAHRHAVLGTLRADGSPRLSGQEVRFQLDELFLGMMPQSRKALDLLADPRMALHAAPDDPELPGGDARISGRATEVTDDAVIAAFVGLQDEMPPGPFHLFRVDVTELSLVKVDGDHLVITWWREGSGTHQTDRY